MRVWLIATLLAFLALPALGDNYDSSGNLFVNPGGNGQSLPAGTDNDNADGKAPAATGFLPTTGYNYTWNAVAQTWDRSIANLAGGTVVATGIPNVGITLATGANQNYQVLRSLSAGADGQTSLAVTLPVLAEQAIYNGATWDRVRTPIKFITLNAVSVASETTIWTPAAGKKFRLMGFLLSTGTVANNVSLKDNTAGTTIFIVPSSIANTPLTSSLGNGILSAVANNVLTATGAATETLSGTIWGTEE